MTEAERKVREILAGSEVKAIWSDNLFGIGQGGYTIYDFDDEGYGHHGHGRTEQEAWENAASALSKGEK